MRTVTRLVTRLVTLLVILARGQTAGAMDPGGGMHGPERAPEATHKLLVLEYENPLGASSGWQISELIGQTALATIKNVDSFAVVTLRQEKERIALTPDHVEDLARVQHTPVVIWGEYYQKNDKLYVTSHVRAVESATAKATPMRISWDISRLGISGVSQAAAAAPTSQVNFAPVEMTRENLKALDVSWNQTQILRKEPKEDSPQSGKLPPNMPFFLVETSGSWSRLKTDGGDSGWVRLTDWGAQTQFKEISGTVLYARGLMQYFAGSYSAAATSFQEYLDRYASGQDAMNQALAHVVAGYSIYLDRSASIPDKESLVERHFQAAGRLLPNSASPVNCLAVALFKKAEASTLSAPEARELEKSLIHVIQTDNDVDAVKNLGVLYQLPRAAEYFATPDVDFENSRKSRLGLLHTLEQKFQPRAANRPPAAPPNNAPATHEAGGNNRHYRE